MSNKHENPFNISFGEEPNSLIDRQLEFNEIVGLFESSNPESKIKIITGPRGCGKTVLLSQIKGYFDEKPNWITADLTQYSNMLGQLAGKLYENGKIKKLFLNTEFNFSFKGFGFTIRGDNPISNVESFLDKIFTYLKRKNINVLVVIDDVANNDYVKHFIQTYQIFLRSKYNVFLLMTGLFENISDLQNVKNLTFLLRAPKIKLSKLNIRAIAMSYKKYLNLDENDAIELAKSTNGYAYAYQLMGNALFKNNAKKLDEDATNAIDLELENNVYGKIWESMSTTDKSLAYAMTRYSLVGDLIKELGMNNAKFQMYRKRLIDFGVADDSVRGSLTFNLPRFKEYVMFQKALLDD